MHNESVIPEANSIIRAMARKSLPNLYLQKERLFTCAGCGKRFTLDKLWINQNENEACNVYYCIVGKKCALKKCSRLRRGEWK